LLGKKNKLLKNQFKHWWETIKQIKLKIIAEGEEEDEESPTYSNATLGNTIKLKRNLIQSNREVQSLFRNIPNYKMTTVSSVPSMSHSVFNTMPQQRNKFDIENTQFTLNTTYEKHDIMLSKTQREKKLDYTSKDSRSEDMNLSFEVFSPFTKSSPHKVPFNPTSINNLNTIRDFEPESNLISNEEIYKMYPLDEDKITRVNSIQNQRRDFYFKDISGKTRQSI
jgi:hypothetical protein